MFVGRAPELAELASLSPERPLALIGEAGIGKTALMRAAATASGRRVLDGGALSTLSWMSYLPITRALRSPPPHGDHAAVAEWVMNRVDGGLLLIDDLHWADQDTLALLPFIAGRVALLTAIRAGDPGSSKAQEHVRGAGFDVLELRELSTRDAEALVRAQNPMLTTAELTEIVRRAAGSPLLLEEYAAGPNPSETLQLLLRARLHRCSRDAQEVMALLGLLGRPAEPGLFPEAAVTELVEAGLATDGDGASPRHTLLGEAAAAELEPERRRRLHAKLARLVVGDPGEAARHHLAAGELTLGYGKALEAVDRATTPGEWARNLAVAAECASGPETADLRVRAAAALVDVGDLDAVERLLAVVEGSEPELLAEAALCRARAAFAGGDLETHERELKNGLALVSGSRRRVEVRLRIERARGPLYAYDAKGALAASRRALAEARRNGLEEARARVVHASALFTARSPTACRTHLREAMRLARATGDIECELEAATQFVMLLMANCRGEETEKLVRSMCRRVREVGLLRWEPLFQFFSASVAAFFRGDYERSIPILRSLLDERAHRLDADQTAAMLVAFLAAVGRDAEARSLLADAFSDTRSSWGREILSWAAMELEFAANRSHETLQAAKQLVRLDPLTPLAFLAARAWAWAAYDGGEEPPPELPAAPRWPEERHAVREHDAVRALARDDLREAEGLFVQAARGWSSCYVYNELRCLWGAAEATRRAGDVTRARRRLLAIESRAEAHGFVPLLVRIRRSLRNVGISRAPVRRTGDSRLTQREREVLALVAEGLKSADAARRLCVSRATVESQIESAMRKLNARTRVQAAALATAER